MRYKPEVSRLSGMQLLTLTIAVLFSSHTVLADVGPNWIEQWGITWTFDKNISTDGATGTYQYGTFANSDYWIVGPLTVTNISPGWNGQSHGSMKNPMPIPSAQQAYDSRMRSISFNSSLLIEAPVDLDPDTSLISAISWTDADSGNPNYPYVGRGVP